MKKRLFLAIPLPENLLQPLAALKDKFALEEGIRWTSRQNLHITVYFFGDIDEEKIPTFTDKLREVFAHTHAFSLQFEKIIFGPPGSPRRPPRMIWADFSSSSEYEKLVKEIYPAIENFLDPESAQETKRKPHLHITLARFHNPHTAKNLKLPIIERQMINVSSCDLMASELTPKGSMYTVLEKYEIK